MPQSINSRINPELEYYPKSVEALDSVQRESKWVTGMAKPVLTTSVVLPRSKSTEIVIKEPLVWTTLLTQIAQDVSIPESILFTVLSCILPVLMVLGMVAIPQKEVSNGKLAKFNFSCIFISVFNLTSVLQNHSLYFFIYVPLHALLLSLILLLWLASDMEAKVNWPIGSQLTIHCITNKL